MANEDKNLDSKARSAAKNQGLLLSKSRLRPSEVNHGGYQIRMGEDPGCVLAGDRFQLTAEDVLQYCRECEQSAGTYPIWC